MPVNVEVELARIRGIIRGLVSQDGTARWEIGATEETSDAVRVTLVMRLPAPAPTR